MKITTPKLSVTIRFFADEFDNFYQYLRELAEQFTNKTPQQESLMTLVFSPYKDGQPIKVLLCILMLLFIPCLLYGVTKTSAKSGNWDVGSTWVGGIAPNSIDNVIIDAEHTVTITSNITITDLTVDSGATLTDGGAAYKIICKGNLYVDGIITTDQDIMMNGTDKSMDGDGTITTSAKVMLIGSKTILVSADLTFSGATEFFINTGSLTNKGEVMISCPITGTADWIQVTNSTLVYKNSTTMSCTLYAEADGNTVEFRVFEAQDAPNPADGYYNLTIAGNNSIALQNNTVINGNLYIKDSVQLNCNGFNINIAGNWTNTSSHSNPFVEGVATLLLDGGADQTINNVNGETFYNITINKGGGMLLLAANSDINITNALTLIDGIIKTDNFTDNLVILPDGATASSGNEDSYVSGKIRKIGNDAFTFPLGDANGSVWARLGISAPSLSTTEYTAQYIFAPHSSTYTDTTLSNASIVEYWTLDQAVNDDDVQITLYWEDSATSGIGNCDTSALVIASYNDSAWTDEGMSSMECDDQGNLTSNVVANYGPFTFGSKSSSENQLPIELIYFTAEVNGNKVDLSWATASETNNDYFTVQKSADGIDFENVSHFSGAGTSDQTLYYSSSDHDPYLGFSYYRLKQTDYSGKFTYPEMVSVNYWEDEVQHLLVYPSPTDKEFFIDIIGNKDDIVKVIITDINGNEYFSKSITLHKDEYILVVKPTEGMRSAMYIVTAINGDKRYRKKLLIQ